MALLCIQLLSFLVCAHRLGDARVALNHDFLAVAARTVSKNVTTEDIGVLTALWLVLLLIFHLVLFTLSRWWDNSSLCDCSFVFKCRIVTYYVLLYHQIKGYICISIPHQILSLDKSSRH